MKNIAIKTLTAAIVAATITCAVPVLAFANDGSAMEQSNMTIDQQDYTAYVSWSEGINVREAATKSSRALHQLACGDSVHVTGQVYENGSYTGWVRVDTEDDQYGGQCSGYVKEVLLSTTPVSVASTQTTDNTQTTDDSQTTEDETSYEDAYVNEYGYPIATDQDQSDAIANVLDEAEESGLYTDEELADTVDALTDLYYSDCETEEEQMERDDQISAILDEMQDNMVSCEARGDY